MIFTQRLVCLSLFSLVVQYAVQAAEAPTTKLKIGNLPVSKVLFLGNSITLHAPAPGIGWTGNWGMAASAQDKDFVHILTSEIAKVAGSRPEIKVRNIATFERTYSTYDIEKELREELDFHADLVIVAIGENMTAPTTEEERSKLAAAFARLLAALQQHGQPAIIVRSSFWPNPTKDGIMQEASNDAGVTFIDIARIGRDKSNAASAERKFEHAGVAAHPGDKGMQAIADALFGAIQQQGGVAAK